MLVSISTMPAGENYLEYVKRVENYADFMHLDVCDGVYNETTCFSPNFAKVINQNSTIPLDCHLMTKSPLAQAENYILAGANIITAQIEAFNSSAEIEEYIKYIKAHNALVGLSIEPETTIDSVLDYVSKIDVLLLMSVKTGKSGQSFNDAVVNKIYCLKKLKEQNDYKFKIEVDGGINGETVSLVKRAGADIVVSGNFVYKSSNVEYAINQLK